jgi:hypothetical protein
MKVYANLRPRANNSRYAGRNFMKSGTGGAIYTGRNFMKSGTGGAICRKEFHEIRDRRYAGRNFMKSGTGGAICKKEFHEIRDRRGYMQEGIW